jgi:hypothetical protein
MFENLPRDKLALIRAMLDVTITKDNAQELAARAFIMLIKDEVDQAFMEKFLPIVPEAPKKE